MKTLFSFLTFFYSPDGENGGGGESLENFVSDATSEHLDSNSGGDGAGDDQGGDRRSEDRRGSDSGQGNSWDGKTERRKLYSGEERRKSSQDPEHELDFEIEQGKGKHKMKLSDLKQGAKWVHENSRIFASMLKIRELAGKHPEFQKVLSEVISRSFNDKGELNGEFTSKMMSQIEAKAEAQQEKNQQKIDDKDENIEQMEKLLEDLEPDSSQAQLLKRSIATQKSLRAQLVEKSSSLEKVIKQLNDRLSGVENSSKDMIDRRQKEESSKAVESASKIFNDTYSELVNQERKDAYRFLDDEEKAVFESEVRNIVAANADKIADDAGYVKTIQDAVKSVSQKYGKRREAIINDYHRRKNTTDKKTEEKPQGNSNGQLKSLEEEVSSLISEATEEHLAGKR